MTQTANSPLYKDSDKRSMYATMLLLLTIGISFFLTANLYSTYSTASEEKASLESRAESLKAELETLKKKKDQVANDKTTKEAIARYASKFREDLILNQIYAKFD